MPQVFDVQFGIKGWDFVYGLCENDLNNPEISDEHYTFIRSIMHNLILGRYWDFTRHLWAYDFESGTRVVAVGPQELLDFLEKYPPRT